MESYGTSSGADGGIRSSDEPQVRCPDAPALEKEGVVESRGDSRRAGAQGDVDITEPGRILDFGPVWNSPAQHGVFLSLDKATDVNERTIR